MDIGRYFERIVDDPEFVEWERLTKKRIEERFNEITSEQFADTKWRCGFIEGMKYVLEDPRKRAQDTKTPAAEE